MTSSFTMFALLTQLYIHTTSLYILYSIALTTKTTIYYIIVEYEEALFSDLHFDLRNIRLILL